MYVYISRRYVRLLHAISSEIIRNAMADIKKKERRKYFSMKVARFKRSYARHVMRYESLSREFASRENFHMHEATLQFFKWNVQFLRFRLFSIHDKCIIISPLHTTPTVSVAWIFYAMSLSRFIRSFFRIIHTREQEYIREIYTYIPLFLTTRFRYIRRHFILTPYPELPE